MGSVPYDWAFNANTKGQIIPGLVSADANGNVTISGNISANGGLINSSSNGTLSARYFSGDISSTYVSITNADSTTTNIGMKPLIPNLYNISKNFDSTSYIYIGKSGIDNNQINSDGDGKLSVNNLDIGNQKSTSLTETVITRSSITSGSTVIPIITSVTLDSKYTYFISGTGITDGTIVSSITTETDTTVTPNVTYYQLTISEATTANIPANTSLTISRITNTTTVNFYTSGNTTPASTITLTGSKGNTSSTMVMTAGDVSFDYNSLTTNITKIILTNIPTSDPKVVNQLWNNGGVLMLSQG